MAETCKPQAFVVQPEWGDDYVLRLGTKAMGEVYQIGGTNGGWTGDAFWRRVGTSICDTEAEARAAVEKAVMKALGGKPV